MEEHSVKVYIYDLSRGMARAMSAMLIGKNARLLDGNFLEIIDLCSSGDFVCPVVSKAARLL